MKQKKSYVFVFPLLSCLSQPPRAQSHTRGQDLVVNSSEAPGQTAHCDGRGGVLFAQIEFVINLPSQELQIKPFSLHLQIMKNLVGIHSTLINGTLLPE